MLFVLILKVICFIEFLEICKENKFFLLFLDMFEVFDKYMRFFSIYCRLDDYFMEFNILEKKRKRGKIKSYLFKISDIIDF